MSNSSSFQYFPHPLQLLSIHSVAPLSKISFVFSFGSRFISFLPTFPFPVSVFPLMILYLSSVRPHKSFWLRAPIYLKKALLLDWAKQPFFVGTRGQFSLDNCRIPFAGLEEKRLWIHGCYFLSPSELNGGSVTKRRAVITNQTRHGFSDCRGTIKMSQRLPELIEE